MTTSETAEQPTLVKTNTKEFFACRKCAKRMETIVVSGAGGLEFFGGSSKQTLFYCDNKECEKFGDLTVVGIKKTE